MKTEKNDSICKWYWISPTIHAGTEPRVRKKYWLSYACNIGAVWGSVSLDLLSTVHYSLLPTKALWFFIHPIGRFKIILSASSQVTSTSWMKGMSYWIIVVMTTLKKVLDFCYFLPFLFSLYHYPEPSRTFYDDPLTSAMTHTLDHSSMT